MAASADSSPALLAALYLEGVLPVLPLLAAHDSALAASLAGPAFSVVFTSGPARVRLSLDHVPSATTATAAAPRPGDLRLWFPTPAQAVRAFDGLGRLSLALPLGGWSRLPQTRRLAAAGKHLETLLNSRPAASDPALALHAYGTLAVALSAAAAWLRHAPEAPATRARLGNGSIVFACPAFPTPLHLDLATLTAGVGEPATALAARITFADLDTVLAELDHQLDGPAALGLGTLRVEGHLLLAENLSLLLLKVGEMLKPRREE